MNRYIENKSLYCTNISLHLFLFFSFFVCFVHYKTYSKCQPVNFSDLLYIHAIRDIGIHKTKRQTLILFFFPFFSFHFNLLGTEGSHCYSFVTAIFVCFNRRQRISLKERFNYYKDLFDIFEERYVVVLKLMQKFKDQFSKTILKCLSFKASYYVLHEIIFNIHVLY